MTETLATPARAAPSRNGGQSKTLALLKEVLGRNRFDDRIDTQPDVTTAQALGVIGRSIRLIAEAKGLFAAKVAFGFVAVFPALFLPWMAKILVDNAILGQPFGITAVSYPPFMDPILGAVYGRDPLGIAMVLMVIYFALLIVFGGRSGATGAGLLEGRDAATQAENQISGGLSRVGGVWGLAEFMVHVRLTQTLSNRLRARLFDRLTHLPMTVLDDQRAGDSVYRVLYDTPMAPDLAYRVTSEPFFMLLGAALNLYILQYSYGEVSPELVWVAWAAVPIAFITTFPFSGALRRTNQNKRAAGSATTNAMEESMSSIAAVQSLGAGEQEKARFAERSQESFLRERYSIAVIIVAASVAGAVGGIAAIYVTILVSDRIIDGVMTVGDFAVLIGVYYGIAEPAGYFGAIWIKLQETVAAARRVFFFADYESDETRQGGRPLARVTEGVRMRTVGFAYPDGHRALTGVNLDLRVGELVALVGPTGAGKTTLAYLIPALLRPTSGRVLVDGVDAGDIDLDALRRQVTYVFQEHLLLPESIRENLELANPEASEERMMAALETAGCMDFIAQLPDGIDTVLGRSGDTLSVGQQQRLSIARGLLRDSSILILDEPTAALDPQTENQLVASLHQAAEDRLVVVIAHRLSTIRNADRIVFLDEGRVRDIGSHDELMADRASAYREFVELQGGETQES
ncbi:MAG: ABC transporter ATP-binding protein [Gammaproteobacteria bacterium]|nr:ABC transporter ATP-binding protein [Gammaproteobacteria bacterium]